MEKQVMHSSTPKEIKLKETIVAMEESKEKAIESNNPKQKSPEEVMSEKRIENQVMDSSISSTTTQEKLKGTIVAMEESKEKAIEINNMKQKSPEEVMSEKRIDQNQVMDSSNSSTTIQEKLKSTIVAMKESKEKTIESNNLKQKSPEEVMFEKSIENQVMPSSSSSTPKSEKLKGIIVAMEESKEKVIESNNLKQKSPQDIMSEKRIEDPSLRYGDVRTGKKIMKVCSPKSDKRYPCNFCEKKFPSAQAKGGHQNAHRKEKKDAENRKQEEERNYRGPAFLNTNSEMPFPYLENALTPDNYLGVDIEPNKRMRNNMYYSSYPSFNNGISDINVNHMTSNNVLTWNNSTNSYSLRRVNPIHSYDNTNPSMHRHIPQFSPAPINTIPSNSTDSFSSRNVGPLHHYNNINPSMPRHIPLISPIPMNTTPNNLVPRENVSRKRNFNQQVIKEKDIVVIDDDDHSDVDEDLKAKYKEWGKNLSLSL